MKTLAVLFLSSFTLGVNLAEAETLTWHVRSNYPYTVHLKLFSGDRNHVWPDTDDVWVLNDYNTHTIPISCRSGEKICYGAWPAGNRSAYWGVGPYGNQGCTDCCYSCTGGETDLRVLN